MTQSLTGIRVIDFTRVLAGPFCSALLADLGAEVIKVEPPQGDDYRAIGPMKDGESALFNVMNRSKQSVVLDLKTDEGRALAQELAAGADVVLENFRPGVAERLGIGYQTLSARNEQLIYVSISGFGQSGPLADRPAYDIILQAMSGLMEATGEPDGAPTLVGEAVSDMVAGIFASWGTLAALLGRERGGKGQHLDVAMFNATLSFLATSVSRFLFTGEPAKRVGNRHPLSAPFGVYEAGEGYFAVAVLNSKLFAAFAEAIERPALADDPRFASDEARSTNEPALRAEIEAWASNMSAEQAIEKIAAAHVPVAPISSIADALNSEHAAARRVLMPSPDAPVSSLPVQPVLFSGEEQPAPRRAPKLGEHTGDVLTRLLGHSAEKIAELRALGALG
ncbi:CaiB/BaiF CoA transferase family protein [Sulfitobacter aestuarii]|uniref:CaiB/BaiF CoA transferase family protein n=1 Tax=Sulfitobacter aestuarii TaxID=2161676 RepID=A0ABW5U2D6_9RHOB